MQPASGIITLLTDFGMRDAYVGAMKGVILSICEDAVIVDISHDIPPHDVHECAWVLRGACRYFPRGTVHVAVVDPGVGGARRAIAVQSGGSYFVGPDNGVLSAAFDPPLTARAFELTNDRYFLPGVSRTFHGRDVFAPAAAHVAAGESVERLGPRISDAVVIPIPRPRVTETCIEAEIVHVDRFGNLITSIDAATLAQWSKHAGSRLAVEIAGRRIDGVSTAYASAQPGELLALVESSGHIEIAVREGSAAQTLAAGRGAPVTLRAG